MICSLPYAVSERAYAGRGPTSALTRATILLLTYSLLTSSPDLTWVSLLSPSPISKVRSRSIDALQSIRKSDAVFCPCLSLAQRVPQRQCGSGGHAGVAVRTIDMVTRFRYLLTALGR